MNWKLHKKPFENNFCIKKTNFFKKISIHNVLIFKYSNYIAFVANPKSLTDVSVHVDGNFTPLRNFYFIQFQCLSKISRKYTHRKGKEMESIVNYESDDGNVKITNKSSSKVFPN